MSIYEVSERAAATSAGSQSHPKPCLWGDGFRGRKEPFLRPKSQAVNKFARMLYLGKCRLSLMRLAVQRKRPACQSATGQAFGVDAVGTGKCSGERCGFRVPECLGCLDIQEHTSRASGLQHFRDSGQTSTNSRPQAMSRQKSCAAPYSLYKAVVEASTLSY